ncbi:MAG: L-threonylcarbamoyladenylate synthase [Anaerolineae bacterium]
MLTQTINARAPQSLALAAHLLRRGDVIALPTDTIYGLAAAAFNRQAVARIYRLKRRPAEKAIPVFVGSLDELGRVCGDVPPAARRLLEQYWPGGLTAILPAHPSLPGVVTHHGPTVAVRIPDHPVVRQLLALLNAPLAVTSANLSGHPTPPAAAGVKTAFNGRVPLVLDDGPSPGSLPSTIVDFTRTPPQILRRGAITVTLSRPE